MAILAAVQQRSLRLASTRLTILFFKILSRNRGLLEVLQLDFVPKDVSEQAESQTISWRLELPGNVKDVGMMRIYTTQRDYVGLAPLVMVRTISGFVSVLFKTQTLLYIFLLLTYTIRIETLHPAGSAVNNLLWS